MSIQWRRWVSHRHSLGALIQISWPLGDPVEHWQLNFQITVFIRLKGVYSSTGCLAPCQGGPTAVRTEQRRLLVRTVTMNKYDYQHGIASYVNKQQKTKRDMTEEETTRHQNEMDFVASEECTTWMRAT